jgi:predicted small metal-binding protein
MAKQIACGELVEGCDFEAGGESEEDLLKQVAAHAAKAHGVMEVTPELAAKVKAAIRTR